MPFQHVFGRVAVFEWTIAAAVFAVIVLVLLFALVRYRARPGREPSQQTEHPKVEIAYAAVLLAVAGIIVGFTSHENSKDFVKKPAALSVDVTGYQWCWQFHYDGTPVDVTATCLNGDYPTLVLPVGQPVTLRLTSKDVIHALWLPDFRFKRDAFPDHTNRFELTITRRGEWLGHCAEFCGLSHSSMLFHVRAVPPDEFRSWLAAQPASGAGS